MRNPTIDHLLARRSVSANSLGEPGPSDSEIEQILTAAARVPDHKKLVPWRFLLFQGEARKAFGEVLAAVCRDEEKDPGQFRLETEANRFLRAPLVIAVISRVVKNPAAPEWEQILRRRRVSEPPPRRHRARLRRAMDHRMVRLQPRHTCRAEAR